MKNTPTEVEPSQGWLDALALLDADLRRRDAAERTRNAYRSDLHQLAVWATALGESAGLSRPLPTAVFFVAVLLSMLGLGWAVKRIPIGTAYAVWTGIGAAGTVLVGILVYKEPATALRVLCLTTLIASIIGLRLTTPT